MEVEFYRQIFEKYPDIKFDENPLLGVESFHADGGPDRQIQES